MSDYNEDPLDLLDDDGDGVVEMCTILGREINDKPVVQASSGKSGCCVFLMLVGVTALISGWSVLKFIA